MFPSFSNTNIHTFLQARGMHPKSAAKIDLIQKLIRTAG